MDGRYNVDIDIQKIKSKNFKYRGSSQLYLVIFVLKKIKIFVVLVVF